MIIKSSKFNGDSTVTNKLTERLEQGGNIKHLQQAIYRETSVIFHDSFHDTYLN
jgi:hypothetical protein